jgi:ribonuclease-3
VYVVAGTGPDHAREFVAVVEIDGRAAAEGRGRSKKEAQQDAARIVLERRTL